MDPTNAKGRQEDFAVADPDDVIEKRYNQLEISPSTAVIDVLAALQDTDAITLSTGEGVTLHDYIDGDALDRLLTHGNADDISMTFTAGEYTVCVKRDRITATKTENTIAHNNVPDKPD